MRAAPTELHQLGLNVQAFKYSDSKSWRGPCPKCGGSRRFVVFTDHEFPLWHGYCSECGAKIKGWERVKMKYDPQKAAAMEAERAREESEREEYRRRKLAEFTTHELWMELQARMLEEHVDWWESQGVPQAVQRYLHIGYTPDKPYKDGDEALKHSPAYTIPWFGSGFQFLTMQYRLLGDGIDRRYIFEDKLGGGRYYYMTEPDQPIKDKVIICEGAKKAIVTQFWLAPMLDFTVLAASSANTFDAALEATKDCGLRYVIFDPDVKPYWRQKAIATNPKTTREIRLPGKVDDLFLQDYLDRDTFSRILRTI